MNTTTITNATNGTIITITRIEVVHHHYGLIALGLAGLACVVAGLWLMFQKPKL